MSERFVVRELEGAYKPGVGSTPHGMSAHVLDTANNYRLMGSFRTEDIGGGREQRRGHVRRKAEQRRAQLELADTAGKEMAG